MIKRKAVKKQDVVPFKMDDPEVARRKAFADAAARAMQDSRDERALTSKGERSFRAPRADPTVMGPDRQRRLRARRRLRPDKSTAFGVNELPEVSARMREAERGKFGGR